MLDEKLYENILLHDISYKNLIGAKPLHIRFDKVVIGIYNATRYLVLFCPEKYDVNYNRIKYLITQKKCSYQLPKNNDNKYVFT